MSKDIKLSSEDRNEMLNNSELDTNPIHGVNVPDVKGILEKFEVMSMQQSSRRDGLDISSLSEQQRDKVLELMHKNEDNSFSYVKEKLRVTENLNEKALDASIVNQKTLRYCLLGGGAAFFIIMLLILFFKDQYFVPFLSFGTGLIGGIGLRSAFGQLTKKPDFINNDEDKD